MTIRFSTLIAVTVSMGVAGFGVSNFLLRSEQRQAALAKAPVVKALAEQERRADATTEFLSGLEDRSRKALAGAIPFAQAIEGPGPTAKQIQDAETARVVLDALSDIVKELGALKIQVAANRDLARQELRSTSSPSTVAVTFEAKDVVSLLALIVSIGGLFYSFKKDRRDEEAEERERGRRKSPTRR